MADTDPNSFQMLELEVLSLKKQLYESESIHRQLESEDATESFEPRRVRVLKSQIVQLERQVLLMSRYISSSKEKLISAEGALLEAAGFLSSHMESSTGPNRSVTLSPAEVKSQIKRYESLANAIKSVQENGSSVYCSMIHNKSNFIKKNKNPTLKDISSGQLSHINLHSVAHLETDLCDLYSNLLELNTRLRRFETSQTSANQNELDKNIKKVNEKLDKTCQDLLSASMLVPTAPWKQKTALPELTVSSIMSSLPKMTSSKTSEVRNLIQTILKLFEHRYSLLVSEVTALQQVTEGQRGNDEEVSIYSLALIDALSSAFNQQQDEIHNTLLSPLHDLVASFERLASNPSDDVLKSFLFDMKSLSPQLENAMNQYDALSMDPAALEAYKSSFKKRLDSIAKSGSKAFEYNHEQHNIMSGIDSALSDLQLFFKSQEQTTPRKTTLQNTLNAGRKSQNGMTGRAVVPQTPTPNVTKERSQTRKVAKVSPPEAISPSASSFLGRIENAEIVTPVTTFNEEQSLNVEAYNLTSKSTTEKDSGFGSMMQTTFSELGHRSTIIDDYNTPLFNDAEQDSSFRGSPRTPASAKRQTLISLHPSPRKSVINPITGASTDPVEAGKPVWLKEMQSDLHESAEKENSAFDFSTKTKTLDARSRRRSRPVDGVAMSKLQLLPKHYYGL